MTCKPWDQATDEVIETLFHVSHGLRGAAGSDLPPKVLETSELVRCRPRAARLMRTRHGDGWARPRRGLGQSCRSGRKRSGNQRFDLSPDRFSWGTWDFGDWLLSHDRARDTGLGIPCFLSDDCLTKVPKVRLEVLRQRVGPKAQAIRNTRVHRRYDARAVLDGWIFEIQDIVDLPDIVGEHENQLSDVGARVNLHLEINHSGALCRLQLAVPFAEDEVGCCGRACRASYRGLWLGRLWFAVSRRLRRLAGPRRFGSWPIGSLWTDLLGRVVDGRLGSRRNEAA